MRAMWSDRLAISMPLPQQQPWVCEHLEQLGVGWGGKVKYLHPQVQPQLTTPQDPGVWSCPHKMVDLRVDMHTQEYAPWPFRGQGTLLRARESRSKSVHFCPEGSASPHGCQPIYTQERRQWVPSTSSFTGKTFIH